MSNTTNQPPTSSPAPAKRLMERLREAARGQQLSRRTEAAHSRWTRRFIPYHGLRHPAELDERHVNAFLTDLAAAREVSPATQSQALAALVFRYSEVLGRELAAIGRLRIPSAPYADRSRLWLPNGHHTRKSRLGGQLSAPGYKLLSAEWLQRDTAAHALSRSRSLL
jgi:hypothetical protein